MKRSLRVKQRDASDCGPACIASICAYYKLRVSVSRIRQYASTDRNGTTMLGMVEAARQLGLNASGIRCSFDRLSQIVLPAMAHFVIEERYTHYVVIIRVSKNKVLLMDPLQGSFVKMEHEEFKRRWTDLIILASPGKDFLPGRGPSTLKRLQMMTGPQRQPLLLVLFLALLVSLAGLSFPLYVKIIFDRVLVDKNLERLHLISLFFLFVILMQAILNFLKDYIILRISRRIDMRLITGYYRHVMQLPQAFFDAMRVGEVLSRINDAIRVGSFVSEMAVGMMVNILIVLFSLAAMFVFYWKLAIMAVCLLAVYLSIAFIGDRFTFTWQSRIAESLASFDAGLVENLTAASTIKHLSIEGPLYERTEKNLVNLMKNVFRGSLHQLSILGTADLFSKLFALSVLWAGTHFVVHDRLSAGELVSFYSLIVYFTSPLLQLMVSSRLVREAGIAAVRLSEHLELDIEKTGGIALMPSPGCPLSIRFHHVHFGYGNREKILRGINLYIPGQSLVGIRGTSGSGKSTIAALLQKIYLPSGGQILIGDNDLSVLETKSLRKRVMVISQHSHLFSATLAENIYIGDPEPDLHKVDEICTRLGITGSSSLFPGGMHTYLPEQGNNLSGGQKQLVAIARALYREPPVLVADEATSAMDERMEQMVMAEFVTHRRKGNTVVIITHNHSLLNQCDTIFTLNNGQIV